MSAVQSLCKNGIVLKNGSIDYSGIIDSCVERYLYYDMNNGRKFNYSSDIEYHCKHFKIDNILVNGSQPQTVFLDQCENKLSFEVFGKVKIPIKLQFIMWLLDKESIKIGSYDTVSFDREVQLNPGEFHIKETVLLPQELTNGEYRIRLSFLQRNIEILAIIDSLMFIQKRDSIIGCTGEEMNYRNTGFLRLLGHN